MDLQKIESEVLEKRLSADRILSGEGDNYDGADGAREVLHLCSICERLIEEIKKK